MNWVPGTLKYSFIDLYNTIYAYDSEMKVCWKITGSALLRFQMGDWGLEPVGGKRTAHWNSSRRSQPRGGEHRHARFVLRKLCKPLSDARIMVSISTLHPHEWSRQRPFWCLRLTLCAHLFLMALTQMESGQIGSEQGYHLLLEQGSEGGYHDTELDCGR